MTYKKYQFRIRTRDGGIIGTSVQAYDLFEAQRKIQQRYPGCQILSGGEA